MKNLLLLLVLAGMSVPAQAFWYRKPTKKQIVYLKTKQFFSNKATLCTLAFAAGALGMSQYSIYKRRLQYSFPKES